MTRVFQLPRYMSLSDHFLHRSSTLENKFRFLMRHDLHRRFELRRRGLYGRELVHDGSTIVPGEGGHRPRATTNAPRRAGSRAHHEDVASHSVERIVDTDDLAAGGPVQSLRINRLMTDGVVEAPHGAHFTECVPDYPRDEEFQRAYVASAKSPEAWDAWKATYLDCGSHDEYRKVVGHER